VLITGESGTGRSWLRARSTMRAATRKAVSCEELPGDPAPISWKRDVRHELRPFPGTKPASDGSSWRIANSVLDEVGRLGSDAQAKAARAIEAREIQRVGGNRSFARRAHPLGNQPRSSPGGAGTFREDLYFRLSDPAGVPHCGNRRRHFRARRDFSEQFLQRSGSAKPRWRSDALQLLRDYPWRHVREPAITLTPGHSASGREITGSAGEDVLIVTDEELCLRHADTCQEKVGDAREPVALGPTSLADKLEPSSEGDRERSQSERKHC